MKRQHTLAALGVALITVAGMGSAAYGQDDDWHFGLALPLFAPSVDGNITVLGHSRPVDISFDKLKDHTEAAFGLGFEARKEKFGFYSGFNYMKFVGVDAQAYDRLQLTIVEFGAFYRIINTGGDHPFILEPLAGIRCWFTKNELATAAVVAPPIPAFIGGKSRDVVDPIIGARASQVLFKKCHLDFSGDFGGFDINNDTDWTWSALGVVTYDFCKWFSLSAGYKALSLDEKNGSGAGQSGVDLVFKGPIIAGKFKF